MIDTILQGDVRSCLKQLEGESVQCCVTSPPYWGLRDYGCEGQIGLEPTPEAYVADLVDVFREVKRVLRNDGTLWLNLGDSYAGSGKGGQSEEKRSENWQPTYMNKGNVPYGCKPKDLVGIPWRVAFALQADGWYLRSDIIWAKPNPRPESVTDRCTKSHEYIFMLSKSERYYYDAEAIKEPSVDSFDTWSGKRGQNAKYQDNGTAANHLATESYSASRNKRDVWTVATQPCAEAHFATFPPKLIEPMILAGTSEKGCCPKCKKPWKRVVEKVESTRTRLRNGLGQDSAEGTKGRAGEITLETLGWQPTCNCDAGDPVPCTVLDPFMGSGTTAIQCVRLHRHYLGCELNPEYVAMAERRIADMVGPLFAEAV